MEARGFLVEGQVQGVGFRWWVKGRATELELRGYVRNLSDGSVEVQAVGGPESLRVLEVLLGRGPAMARVRLVRAIAVAGDVPRERFEIRREWEYGA